MSDPAAVLEALGGRRVCVTGGAGFIGSHICDTLLEAGAEVSVIDDLSTGLTDNLSAPVRLVTGSILDDAALASAIEGAEIVFHLAALTSVPRSVAEPASTMEVNATGTLNVLEAARRGGAKRIVFSSSSSVYGDAPISPKVETMRLDPRSPYAASKCTGEHLMRSYACCHGLACVSLRYFNIFGPRQRFDSPYAAVLPLFAEAMLEGRSITICGDGTQTRDFTHVANAVEANILAAICQGPLEGEAINVACGTSFSVLDLADRLDAALGLKSRREFEPPRPGDVMHSLADLTAARALIGYEPAISFDEGLADAVGYYAENAETPKR